MVRLVEVIGGGGRMRRETKNQTSTNTKVINKHFSSRTAIRLSQWIGRPTKWALHRPIKNDKMRDQVCDEYAMHIATRLLNLDVADQDFREFDGKNMLCLCAPKRCHGDTLLMLYRLTHEERLEWAQSTLST